MPALPPYLPQIEADFNNWLLNFSSLITANPAAYGLPPTDATTLPLMASPTKSPFLLQFKSTQAGQQLYLAARWATRTGLVSPWSPIINFTVVAGG